MEVIMNQGTIEQQPKVNLLWQGVAGGIVAGIIFAMAEMILNVLMGKPFFGPLRLIGSIVLGQQALAPTYPLVSAAIVGLIVHMIMSMMFGLIFIYALAALRQVQASSSRLLVYGSLFGLALWVVNFLILAPVLFPQFTMVNQFWNGFFAHTFFFGAMIGGYVSIVKPKHEVIEAQSEGRTTAQGHSHS
jgi:uncharacterized membrane protein YagU involved in acid resistance